MIPDDSLRSSEWHLSFQADITYWAPYHFCVLELLGSGSSWWSYILYMEVFFQWLIHLKFLLASSLCTSGSLFQRHPFSIHLHDLLLFPGNLSLGLVPFKALGETLAVCSHDHCICIIYKCKIFKLCGLWPPSFFSHFSLCHIFSWFGDFWNFLLHCLHLLNEKKWQYLLLGVVKVE